MVFLFPVNAETPEDLLSRGWREYQFLALKLAEQAFREVLQEDLTPHQAQEASVGLAMSLQYPEHGRNLEASQKIYESLLEQELEPEVRDLVLSNLADLYLALGDPEKATELLDRLVSSSLGSVLGQEALRRRLVIEMGELGSETSRAVADEAAGLLQGVGGTRKDPKLLPLLHEQIGTLYFWLGDYEKAVFHYEKFSILGTAKSTSYGLQAQNLYRLAKLNEDKLENLERAGHFYRRLVLEYPNSTMVYYSLEKAAELGTVTKAEVQELRLSGMTDKILNDVFSNSSGGGS